MSPLDLILLRSIARAGRAIARAQSNINSGVGDAAWWEKRLAHWRLMLARAQAELAQ